MKKLNLKKGIFFKRKSKKLRRSYRLLKRKEMMSIAENTYNNIRYNFKAVLCFEMCYRLLVAFIFVPLNYFIVHKFMKSEEIFALTNKEFLKFASTPIGIISTILLMILSFIVIFGEISVLTYIAYKSHKREKVTIIDGVFNSFAILPKVLGISMIPLFLVTAVIGPLIGVGFCSSLIKKLSIPTFVTLELAKTMSGKIAYAVFMFILIILLFRWVLAIPQIIIENKRGYECLNSSKRLYRKNKLTILVYMSIWVLINSMIISALMIIFTVEETILACMFGRQSISFLIVGGISLIIFYALYIIASIGMMPLFISFLVELFYKIRPGNIEERNFKEDEDYYRNKLYKISKSFSRFYLRASLIIFTIFICIKGFDVVFNMTIQNDAQISAHRGSAEKAPENSISSIKAAIDDGADYAEIDVQTTKDNVVVLFHDINLKRIDGSSKAIKDLTYEEVTEIDNGSYFSKDFAGEQIPTLETILLEAKGKIKLNIELKPIKKDDTLPEEVIKLIKKYDMEDEVVITSMDYDCLQKAKSYDPIVKFGYIIVMSIGDIEELDVDFISIESSLVKPDLVTSMHRLGKQVHVWTVNDEDEAKRMMALGVDNIITDKPTVIKNVERQVDLTSMDYLQFYLESIINIGRYSKI